MDGTAVPDGGLLEGDGDARWKHEREKERGVSMFTRREEGGMETQGS